VSNYIAIDLKVMEVTGPAVARAMGLEVATVIGSLSLLWHRCWSSKSDRVGSLELRGYFQHPEAGPLLEAFGLLEKAGDQWRVKGADRYLRISEQRKAAGLSRSRSAGRVAGKFTSDAPAADQRTTSGPPALAPSTEHRTPNSKKLAGKPRAAAEEADLSEAPDWKALVARIVEMAPGYAFTPRDARALKACLALAKGDALDVAWRWGVAWRHEGFPRVRAIHELERTWNHWAGKAVATSAAPVAVSDWGGATTGTTVSEGL